MSSSSAVTMRSKPCSANCLASSRPIPLEAPVTRASGRVASVVMAPRFPVCSRAHRIGRAPIGKDGRMALPRADLRDTVGVVADVVLPLFARGIIVRRQRVVGALDRLDADRRAVRRLQRLRREYGPGPVLLRGVPGREVAFVLDADTARRVLD